MLISIICYAHNPKPAHFQAMLASLRAQQGVDWELVLIDDASDPPLPGAVVRCPERFGMLNVHWLWSLGIRHARGDLLTCIGSDDLMWPGRLARIVPLFEDDLALDLVWHDALFIDDAGLIVPADTSGGYQHFLPPPPRDQLYRQECTGTNVVPHPCVIYRRSLHERLGFPEWGPNADHQFWLRCSRDPSVTMCYLPEMWLSYRQHPGSGSVERGHDVAEQGGRMLTHWMNTRHAVGLRRSYG